MSAAALRLCLLVWVIHGYALEAVEQSLDVLFAEDYFIEKLVSVDSLINFGHEGLDDVLSIMNDVRVV